MDHPQSRMYSAPDGHVARKEAVGAPRVSKSDATVMKYLSSQFGMLFAAGETRQNLAAFLKYLGFLALLVAAYAVVFHLIMENVEGQQHSWITGLYWTLVVMTT